MPALHEGARQVWVLVLLLVVAPVCLGAVRHLPQDREIGAVLGVTRWAKEVELNGRPGSTTAAEGSTLARARLTLVARKDGA